MGTKIIIPNMVTLSNLLLGIISLNYTMNEQYTVAAISILLAMMMDGMDGKIARKLDVASNFGKQLDSLCDLVSFGVAPALLVYGSSLQAIGPSGLIIALIFALCGAIRLARFNVLDINDHFIGVPITFAGSLLALAVLIASRLPLSVLFFSVFTLLLAYLMVSNLKVPKY
ncbi:CDP-diacylglycerol--serine O-phosphatidyltransferase [Desulfonispora thiosulfatigenes DSM 11270]|uniref:CDP-diacylglycerol--serine O-phosphatidyltransferase n=1 Tax=Desulfonispora thiosulfatigenes DSM 11270 TaxID=656914 RepID=A0A1W1VMU0_DESTI|nr:CDP-diacylglycerol--serine O-phosphatidyltransferase [Desulfonispora thiosulfatigenes]SMB94603.1 CDP-diacylglycerol--serine O-phosphatidyltransferase [Desulfonispora thiosulfatigenes DSM 11270]